jgi:hypothetical protein
MTARSANLLLVMTARSANLLLVVKAEELQRP